eukprot:2504214-Prymnesium_polylepis.1
MGGVWAEYGRHASGATEAAASVVGVDVRVCSWGGVCGGLARSCETLCVLHCVLHICEANVRRVPRAQSMRMASEAPLSACLDVLRRVRAAEAPACTQYTRIAIGVPCGALDSHHNWWGSRQGCTINNHSFANGY